jgi:RimJ/RimL family protein N-acetyltransferase
MSSRLHIEPLCVQHMTALAAVLRHPAVYEHIGGVPSLEHFVLDRERALNGPPRTDAQEHWLNYLVRERGSGQMLGRLEATVHDGLAEVAFLFGPAHWGRGFALEALTWLHEELERRFHLTGFWATTVPANTRCQSLLLRSGYSQVRAQARCCTALMLATLSFRSPRRPGQAAVGRHRGPTHEWLGPELCGYMHLQAVSQ